MTRAYHPRIQHADLKKSLWPTGFLGAIPQSILHGTRIILCLVFIIIVVLGSFFLLPANLHYHVTERYIFTGTVEDSEVYLGVLLPKSGPYQWVGDIEVIWDGVQLREDHGFVDAIKFSGNKSGGADLEALIEYDVKLPQGYISWTAPVVSFQRLPQTGIESDSLPIQEQAALLGDGMSERDAYKIYSFTANYLTYSEAIEDCGCANASALKAYKTRSCVCTGFARLMTALCRASSIPSQMIIGMVYPPPILKTQDNYYAQNPGEAHAWVEYYSEDTWKMADPTWGSEYLKLLQFNRNDGRHLSYGELEQLLSVAKTMNLWALDQADQDLGFSKCFRCIATSNSDQISLISMMSIQKAWDGRWANTILIWAITTWLLRKYRYKIIGLPRQKIDLTGDS